MKRQYRPFSGGNLAPGSLDMKFRKAPELGPNLSQLFSGVAVWLLLYGPRVVSPNLYKHWRRVLFAMTYVCHEFTVGCVSCMRK
jgi:hypothetical protein